MMDSDNPDSWQAHEHRIYASNDPDFFVLVDAVDYPFLSQFAWSVHTYNNGLHKRDKLYLRRSVSDFHGPDGSSYISEFTGRPARNRQRVQRNLFLHFVVMLRKAFDENCYPSDSKHHIVDHEDRDTANCRRKNLRWSTASSNTSNTDRQYGIQKGRPKLWRRKA